MRIRQATSGQPLVLFMAAGGAAGPAGQIRKRKTSKGLLEMTMRSFLRTTVAALLPIALAGATGARAQQPDLDSFAILSGTEITNTGAGTSIIGNVGLHPGTNNELLPSQVDGMIFNTDAIALQAKIDLVARYLSLQAEGGTLLGPELNTITLEPGAYQFSDSAQISVGGELTLDALGDPAARFVFNIPTTLTAFAGSKITLINGAQGKNVFFRVGSSATLNANADLVGQIVALTSIQLLNGARLICGAALAQNANVTLDTNTITAPDSEECAFAIVGDVVDDDSTTGEVVDVIEDYVDGGGDLPDAFQDLVDILDGDLTPEEIKEVLGQLAGETSTGVAPTVTQSMNSFLSTVLNSGTAPGTERSGPKVATVKALGYAGAATLSPAGSAVSSFGESSTALELNTFDIWAGVYGSNTNADGDSGDGTHDRSSDVYGIAGGVDFNVDHDTRVGIALSGGTTAFDLSDNLGDGESNVFQTAIYARQEFDAVYILGALAYGYHDVSTDRTITLPSPSTFTEDLSADFVAHDIAAQIEAGYRMGWLTPYGAVRVQSIHTPSYSEESNSAVDGFALDYDANTATNVRTEIGARMERILELQDGASLAFRSRIAWAHDFWYGENGRARFQSLPGSESFTVRGTSGAEDSLLLSAGAEFGFGNGLALAGWFDGELAEDSETYGGNVRISYGW